MKTEQQKLDTRNASRHDARMWRQDHERAAAWAEGASSWAMGDPNPEPQTDADRDPLDLLYGSYTRVKKG